MSLKELQHKSKNTADSYSFEGVPIFAASGIHEKAFEILSRENLKNDDSILVLGSGAGAFDKRLLSSGYTNITSVEFVEGVHQVPGVKLLNIDLNKDFSQVGGFKAIMALEIIEHLENEFHFIREISKIMKNDGFVIISTPNIESSFARIKYALTGKLHWFAGPELDNTGHIHPIFEHIFRFNLNQSGLHIVSKETNNNIWFDVLFKYKNILIRIVYFVMYFISLFIQKKDSNNINIFLIKKKDL